MVLQSCSYFWKIIYSNSVCLVI